MDPALFGALPASACVAGSVGADGPDRIVRKVYDAADNEIAVITAFGTTEAAAEQREISPNGITTTIRDGESNLTTYGYDGFDRLIKTRFPMPTKGANASSVNDFEQLTYDANSRVTQRQLRDGTTIDFTLDNLGRITDLGGPATTSRNFRYNLLGKVTNISAVSSGCGLSRTYDALGRVKSDVSIQGSWTTAIDYLWDSAGNRTRITWPDGLYAQYDYDTLGNVTAVRENGAASGIGVLASYYYDNLGRPSSIVFGNGSARYLAYDAVGRLSSQTIDLAGTVNDLNTNFTYNSASQIASVTRSNDAYAWGGHYNVDRPYTVNGLNQLTASGATALGYDARGNLASSGSASYLYDWQNLLKSVNGTSLVMDYDPLNRLSVLNSGGQVTHFIYADGDLIAEYNNSNILIRRHVPAPGTDEPMVWYEGAGTTDRRFLQTDERGSVVAISDASGSALAINRYDEYGIPQSGNVGRFQYTGQAWLPELGMYSFKARMYSPTLGRFMQTDPIGYGDGLNWYNYVGSDPVNATDPIGLWQECRRGSAPPSSSSSDEIVVTANKINCTENGLDNSSYSDLFDFWRGNIRTSGFEIGFKYDSFSKTTQKKQPICAFTIGQTDYTVLPSDANGHLHNPDTLGEPREDIPGPGDGGKGVSFVGTSAGIFIVTRYGRGDYSVGLLAGRWGDRNAIKARIGEWNRNDGLSNQAVKDRGAVQKSRSKIGC